MRQFFKIPLGKEEANSLEGNQKRGMGIADLCLEVYDVSEGGTGPDCVVGDSRYPGVKPLGGDATHSKGPKGGDTNGQTCPRNQKSHIHRRRRAMNDPSRRRGDLELANQGILPFK